MKGRTIFGVVGWGLIGLMVLGFVLHAFMHIKTGGDGGYRNYKNQPMTYLGALASLGVVALVGVVAMYYRLKRMLGNRRQVSARE